MTTPADLTVQERVDATLVVRLLGALAQGATTKRGSDTEVRLLRACTTVAADLGVADRFVTDCLALLGFYLIQGRDDDAVPILRREIAVRKHIDDSASLVQAYGRLSRALENAGQAAEAVDALANGFETARGRNAPALAVTLLLDRARILGTKLSRFGDAMQALRVAHALSENIDADELKQRVRDQLQAALTWILRAADAAENTGDTDAAAEHYRLVDESARAVDLRSLAAIAQYNHARMLAATLHRPDEAAPRAEDALKLAREEGLDDLLKQARQLVRAIQQDIQAR